MLPQYQALVKDVDLELKPINLKEGDCYVINHGEGLMAINFDIGDAATAGTIDRSEGQREKRYGRRFTIRLQEGRRRRTGVEAVVCCSWGREGVAARLR
ncbi:hypothetical protein BHE74_00018660 [Ensete ventricosum]|nr:hypothetical protein GW17_00054509 [Ensete ventricosum]RWW73473.1 hypothetical protein BHE74_00018660 [Ensete ventricosum]RZR86727.1 hypothetical protein BHM03_00013979 [Ensete ventricosum]